MAQRDGYLPKAKQSLQGAESELAQARFDNAVNRAYYACFQAAVDALIAANVSVQTETGGVISHKQIHSNFAELLIRRRKVYSSQLRNVLQDLLRDRILADYRTAPISSNKAARAVRQAQLFVGEIATRLQAQDDIE
jgi:uncharacterized protein (UPF0332 family)